MLVFSFPGGAAPPPPFGLFLFGGAEAEEGYDFSFFEKSSKPAILYVREDHGGAPSGLRTHLVVALRGWGDFKSQRVQPCDAAFICQYTVDSLLMRGEVMGPQNGGWRGGC